MKKYSLIISTILLVALFIKLFSNYSERFNEVESNYSNVSESTSFTIKKCKNRQYRLAWDVYSKGNSVGNSDGWLYIDNIKVSIAN